MRFAGARRDRAQFSIQNANHDGSHGVAEESSPRRKLWGSGENAMSLAGFWRKQALGFFLSVEPGKH